MDAPASLVCHVCRPLPRPTAALWGHSRMMPNAYTSLGFFMRLSMNDSGAAYAMVPTAAPRLHVGNTAVGWGR